MNDPGNPPEPGSSPVQGEAPAPDLDPVAEAAVRELLRSAPDPGPMPDAVAGRIGAALAAARDQGSTAPDDHSVLLPLVRQRQRPRRWLAVAAVAAAAAVVAVGASALHVSTDPGRSAIAVAGSPPARTPSATPTDPAVHIRVSTTDYAPATLADQARLLVDDPGQPLDVLAAEAPTLGPIATEIGLASCLGALGAGPYDEVSADLGTYEGRPAAVLVVRSGAERTAYAVERSCTTGSPGLLAGPVPMP